MFFDGYPNPNGPVDVQTFLSAATVDLLQMQTWRKPAGKSMAYMICIGGGGGGGGGFTGVAASARGGGGGGGSSGVATLTIPLIYLPDTLYIQVGAGGAGVGSGGGTAGSGVNSSILLRPSVASATTNRLLLANNAVPTGGGTGTAAAVGAAGAAGSIATITIAPLSQFGQVAFVAGQAGAAGGAVAGAIGPPASIPVTGVRTMGGGGGAGTTSADFAGSIVTTLVESFLSDCRPAGAAAGSNSGSAGHMLWKPFWSFCGLGGASSNAAAGGNGGNAAYGSGGGGGGGGTTGGTGGKGGDGIVIIVSW